jgi:phosphomevalonate kinase
MKKLLYFMMAGAVAFSCSSPMNKKFSEETANKDLEEIRNELDSTEAMLLMGTMIRLKMQDKDIESMTYKEILEDEEDGRLSRKR